MVEREDAGVQYFIASTVLLLKSAKTKEREDRFLMTNLVTSNQSGTFLTILSGISGDRKNRVWCLCL